MAVTRLVARDDAAALARLVTANREYLAQWSPVSPESYFTEAGQRDVLARNLAAYERGLMLPRVILDEAGAVCGRINLNDIVRGAYQGCSVGYWVSQSHAGRGLASAALAETAGIGFGELGLHQLQAATLLHNTPSQHVLTRNGFRAYAVAEAYLKIAGRWQDHILFQRLSPGRLVRTGALFAARGPARAAADAVAAAGLAAEAGAAPPHPGRNRRPGLVLRLGRQTLGLVLDIGGYLLQRRQVLPAVMRAEEQFT